MKRAQILKHIMVLLIFASGVSAAYSTQAQDGTLKWLFSSGGEVVSSPAIDGNGIIYVGSSDSNLYAINPDGSERWRFGMGGAIIASPALGARGIIYVGSGAPDSALYAIRPDGNRLWRLPIGGDPKSSPAIGADGTIYISSHEYPAFLYAIHPQGREKWRVDLNDSNGGFYGAVTSSPSVGIDGTIYVGTDLYGGEVIAFNPDGTKKWSRVLPSFDDGVRSSPTIGSDGTVYVGWYNDYNIGNLVAYNLDGTEKWSIGAWGSLPPQDINNVISSPAVGPDGTIYVGTGTTLFAIAPDGAFQWSFAAMGGSIESSPAVGADGTVYVGSHDNHLYAVNSGGTEKWHFAAGGPIESSPAIGPDGTIYVGSSDGNLYAINGSSGGLTDGVWPMFRQGLRRTGRVSSPPGGSITGLSGLGVICKNQTTQQKVSFVLDGSVSWNCEVEGLVVSTDDEVLQVIAGVIDQESSIGGSITGQYGVWGACVNVTTEQRVSMSLTGVSSWDCEAEGLVVNPGDRVRQLVQGTVH